MLVQIGRLAGQLVSAAFPGVMDLKFERVCQPFMMLHVNRLLPSLLLALPHSCHHSCLPWAPCNLSSIWLCITAPGFYITV